VEFPVGVGLRTEAPGALALMDFLLRHGPELLESAWRSMPVYRKPGACSWMAANPQFYGFGNGGGDCTVKIDQWAVKVRIAGRRARCRRRTARPLPRLTTTPA